MTRWEDVRARAGISAADRAASYAAGLEATAAEGLHRHGEADLVASLVPRPASILDAGCGIGRVAIRLAELGYEVLGVDVDADMLAHASETAPHLPWVTADLTALDLGEDFAAVVCAGNVIPLLAPDTEIEVIRRLADHLRPGGLLITGFGLDSEHLPMDEAPFGIADYDGWCVDAGLMARHRWATWDRDPWSADAGYAVSVHSR